ncbi:membrane protein implicated in regulation of membrane protease activity [Kibdelosporangium banguiense]|uniref:Membrane protein implicated in regulation of membrane protease activity n=1 Tax=Kibdelosporangium banguiense TaxID=1365924 RepID=A0ABS4U1C8_9PSEU|nr:hypothetical protein [Kibdelosporangium banguiense]MBP2330453.1 membrane protein implicated in regulation of membrane protease activity [Kibdelosporangium banguiense]
METHGHVTAAEALAALASTEQSRARVAWAGYPAWHWYAIGAGMAAVPLTTLLSPLWLGLTSTVALTLLLLVLTIRTSRARGVCEGWTRSAMRLREAALLYGPTVFLLTAGSFMALLGWWAPVTAAVLGFAVFTITAHTLRTRAARQ